MQKVADLPLSVIGDEWKALDAATLKLEVR